MKKRHFMMLLAAATSATLGMGLSVTAPPAFGQTLSLSQIDAYLNSVKNFQADFTQINSDGSSSSGTLYIARPGKMRFEYNPPTSAQVIASAGTLVVIDGKSNSGPKTYPLRQTPLWQILAPEIDLLNSKNLAAHGQSSDFTTIDLIDPKRPQLGQIRLFFQHDPIVLKQWVVRDQLGQNTTVVLDSITYPDRFTRPLFRLPGY